MPNIVVADMTEAELAHHLAYPEGEIGSAVMWWVDGMNTSADCLTLKWLDLRPEDVVLEIGFGSGRLAPKIVGAEDGIAFVGLELSPTMVDEASVTYADFVRSGAASFKLGSADRMPFEDAAFDRIVSIGVAHFWADPLPMLAEIKRVSKPDGLVLVGCLHPDAQPSFAQPELGFHIRQPPDWEDLFRRAGFSEVAAEAIAMPDDPAAPSVVLKVIARP